jgi:hypothetical protein
MAMLCTEYYNNIIILTIHYCQNHLQAAQDFGGPRKEFFRLILKEIKEIYFDKELREHLQEKYTTIGIILGIPLVYNIIHFT